uniref:OTU domain-containing protein n=2 Tax=Panagrolaimus sp. PS1159 TaxID=55785 RepID=A0AC35G260_9BILA
MLPSSLEDIFFNGNHLTSIETVQHLKNLRRLSVTRNKITKITSDFNQLKNLVEIDLNYNCLISLPKGFELIHTSAEDGLTLCLAGNKFDYDKQNLNEDLWTKLPMIKTLNIWENKIDSLPCQLADRLEANSTIVASDCDIRHVCPKIYSKFKKLNLYNNELDALTFIPKTILQPPISQRKITVEYSSDLKVLDMHASIAKPPASFPKLFKKPEYTFNTITKKKNILNQVQCKCCAECNSSSRDTLMVQQMMVMDFNLRVNSKYEEVGDDYDTRETIYSSGGWVSKIRTRLCDPCKSEILLKVEESYQSFINDENAEIVKPKQSRIEKNFEASLQAPHEPMVATAELTTENTSLLPQLQQPSTSHYLPSIKTLYSHKNGFEDDHFAVYQDPVCDMTNTENAGYINDLPQKIILLNEGGIQVAEFDHSNDPSMLQQDAIRADQSKNQPLNDMQLDSTIHETNKEMDITDEYIVDLVLDMMEDHKVADNQNLDLNECEIVFENLQPKTILEANKNDERVEEDGRQFYEYPIEGFNNNVILQARHYNFIMPEIYDLQISIPPMIEDLQRYLNLLELPSQLAANSPLLNFASVTTAGKNMITVSTLADGNCGYRAISILLTGVEDYFWKIRIKIYDHIVVNGHRIWGIGSQEQKIKFYKKLERILKMKKPTAVDLEFWCKNEDLYALADLFECNVYTYSPNPLSNYPNITGHYKNGEKIPHSPTLFLMWINNNHFEPILGFV